MKRQKKWTDFKRKKRMTKISRGEKRFWKLKDLKRERKKKKKIIKRERKEKLRAILEERKKV